MPNKKPTQPAPTAVGMIALRNGEYTLAERKPQTTTNNCSECLYSRADPTGDLRCTHWLTLSYSPERGFGSYRCQYLRRVEVEGQMFKPYRREVKLCGPEGELWEGSASGEYKQIDWVETAGSAEMVYKGKVLVRVEGTYGGVREGEEDFKVFTPGEVDGWVLVATLSKAVCSFPEAKSYAHAFMLQQVRGRGKV